ncbi:glycoside hydrolase family 16 protein [Vibrio methylphosphonaticus]|uniref:glycoside hydrolase family 16 protein n=1 Tax=Vibrio methylphosphonaticus TaxID=2946866 RepID=UPI00202A23C1|nr:glycoside hydrolase family 16 protein [Vibrio methylphosphonaticus]MCL9774102.1 family 16 glycosylhydrolase [Vibrio methylphosphonaticus]
MIKNVTTRSALSSALLVALFGCSSTSEPLTFSKEELNDPTGSPDAVWNMVWNDEFQGDEIDKSKWSHEENCWGGGNNEQQCYTKRKVNSFVDNGVLHIVAKEGSFTGPNNNKGDMRSKATLPFTSARLRTLNKGDWKYGRFEIRARLPHGQGTWPAIWMLPTDQKYGTWAASGEIDIMEAVNLKVQTDIEEAPVGELESRIYGTLHYGRQWPENVSSGTDYHLPNQINPADGFHTYAVEWEEGEVRWYVDNIHFATQRQDGWYSQYKENGSLTTAKESAPFNERFHMLINLAVGGSWSANRNEGGIDNDIFPQTLAVDYVRVFECSVDPDTGKGCATVSDDAKFVKGNAAPPIIIADKDYGKGNELSIFGDELNKHLVVSGYDPDGQVSVLFIDEPKRGKVIELTKKGKVGNAYFITPELDLSDWADKGELVFDIKVPTANSDSQLLVKMDSGWPLAGDYEVPLKVGEQWQEVRIPLSQLVSNGNRFAKGSTVDLSKVKNLLVLEPNASLTVFLDNIRLVR